VPHNAVDAQLELLLELLLAEQTRADQELLDLLALVALKLDDVAELLGRLAAHRLDVLFGVSLFLRNDGAIASEFLN
jgi:hypothetical protein